MQHQRFRGFKPAQLIIFTMAGLGSTAIMATSAEAVSLQLTIENLGPTDGALITPLWVGLHDGSFDTFDFGTSASTGIEIIAEEGLTGLETPDLLNPLGINNLGDLGIEQNLTLASLFNASAAGANGGLQDLLTATPIIGTFPSETASIILNVDPNQNRYLSYAAMFFPSNDAFIGNEDQTAIELFDDSGNFLGADFLLLGTEVWDAGTEVNDESLNSVPFTLPIIGEGIVEGGTVQPHPGLMPPGSGGVLDFDNGIFSFANADFQAPGYQVARITVTEVEQTPEPSLLLGILTFISGILFSRRKLPNK
ncbi:MAG: spondin domain-containing protein [Xenococcaceae cyanobacterium MO_167.B27]|nr:spondin domain-containing protein [Xenococcaceae cyanobacterium MO_167.B27]